MSVSRPAARRAWQQRAHADRTVGRTLREALTPGELAWVAALPCAALTLAAVVLLGPPLGHTLFAPSGEGLWPRDAGYVWGSPEPVKHARFALALLGPLLLAGCVLAGARRPPRLAPAITRALVTASQALLCAALVGATVAQRHVVANNTPAIWRIFSVPTLVVGALLALALAIALRRPALARRIAQPPVMQRRWAAACLLLAVVATVVWVLPAVGTEHTAAADPFPDLPSWSMADTYAVLDGRTPLVDYHAVYGQLWGYLAAAPMALFGATIGVFTSVMALASALAMLAVYATLRRLVRDPLIALVLYLPWLATSLFVIAAPANWRMSNVSIFSAWPMRYAGPWLLAWLTVRHLDGARPRLPWLLALVGGLIAINNVEFGLAGLAATLVALACVPERRSTRALGRLAASGAVGVLAAAALIALLTLVRAGSLPRIGLLFEFPHVFGALGLAALPMPTIGFHLVIYATFAAALATAAVRLVRGEDDVPLTAMLAWSGVFGLGCASYYAGRSDALKLAALFPAWGFALMLLLVVLARVLAERTPRRLPSLAELAVLVGFGLTVCSLAQVQAPWREMERLHEGAAAPIYRLPSAHQFVGALTQRGERVALLMPLGHRVAYELGLVNVSPYGHIAEVVTRAQWRTLFDAMRDEGARLLFLSENYLSTSQRQLLERTGFVQRRRSAEYSAWEDAAG
jgi:hypothetical protein